MKFYKLLVYFERF